MQKIHIKRDIGKNTGYIEPDDRSWQLVIDDDGIPHLWVRVSFADERGDEAKHGMVAVDDFLLADVTIEGLMTECEFGGQLSPDEEALAYEEYKAQCEAGKRPPCPR